MATYQFAVTSASREFKVKDEKEVLAVFQELGYEESYLYDTNTLFIGSWEKCIEDDIVIVEKATGKAVAVYTDSCMEIRVLSEDENEIVDIDEETFEDEEKYSKVVWFDYLQSKLLDDKQIAVLSEAGYEKLRFASGYVCVISKQGIFHNSIDSFVYNTIDKIEKEQVDK